MKQKSTIQEIFQKRIGEMLEQLEYAGVDLKLKDIVRKSTWRICDELEGKFKINGEQNNDKNFNQ